MARLNVSKTLRYGSTKYILLGNFPERINANLSDKEIFFKERLGAGIHILEANPGQGKSVLIGNMISQRSKYDDDGIAWHRPVVIFDYMGEHARHKRSYALNSTNNPGGLPFMEYYEGFKYKISQYGREEDWVAMGFSENAAPVMKDLASKKEIHLDDPNIFYELMQDLSANKQQLWNVAAKWNIKLPPSLHPALIQGMFRIFHYMWRDKFFADPTDRTFDFGRITQSWKDRLPEELKDKQIGVDYHYPVIVINFGVDLARVSWARSYAGKAMEQVRAWIKIIARTYGRPPALIFEEGDKLFPNISEESKLISSLLWGLDFAKKLQKEGIEMIILIQNIKSLHPGIWEEYDTMILGPDSIESIYGGRRKKMKWSVEENYREFLIVEKGGGYDYFVPLDSATLY